MANKRPPEFTNDEIRLSQAIHNGRYGRDIGIPLDDNAIRLNLVVPEPTKYPVVIRDVDDHHFLLARTDCLNAA